ncbi:hypothetical protein COLO4_23660 [Corchorus olitorius]|uniref:Uncharacterized protein n=1 Tax=Corchorus olitorius TaxID=93759 RepID=A0A1R3IFE3_9ROSI|nr:hypothetical protein COLO4_23660 [Corchorus olitorius]
MGLLAYKGTIFTGEVLATNQQSQLSTHNPSSNKSNVRDLK